MFLRKTRKSFSISTSRVYLVGKRSLLQKTLHFFLPYTQKSGYRMSRGSALMAL